MKPYHKIYTLWERDPRTKYKTLIEGRWALPVFAALKDAAWHCYEKVDGTNVRVLFNKGEVVFYGKNNLMDKDGAYRRPEFHGGLWGVLLDTFNTEFFHDNFDMDKVQYDMPICLYGEGFGRKIQGGDKYGEPDFCLFDIMIGNIWMEQDFVASVAKSSGLQQAPFLGTSTLEEVIETARLGFDSSWGYFPAEGIIVRPGVELVDRLGNRVIGKIKTRDL
jgi:hypothetical protein